MCYFYGFGVEPHVERMLELLREAASLKNPMAMAICNRMHQAYSQVLPSNFEMVHPILQIENELQGLPVQEYFSNRIRCHEKLFQQAILDESFDIFSDDVLVAKDLNFSDLDQIQDIVSRDDINASSLVGVSSLVDVPPMGSLLHLVTRLGQLTFVMLLVQAGADVNLQWEGCGTPLISACRGGHPDVVRFLLSNGAKASRQSGAGPSPLHWMVMFEEDQLQSIIEALKEHSGDINEFSSEMVEMREHFLRIAGSPLHFAISARYYKLAEVLIQLGATTTGGVMTPLDFAVAYGIPELTALLLKGKPSSGLATPLLHQGLGNALGKILLHGCSARRMLESTVDLVLKSNFSDINAKDENGLAPLACAINDCPCEINLDELEVLINHGACLNITSRRVVHMLGGRNDGRGGRIMKLLLDTGKVVPEPSLLAQSCLYGDEDILKAILEFGVDVNLPDTEDGGSIMPLHSTALVPGNFPLMKLLLDHGADVTAKYEGRTALELAIMSPIADGDVIDLLIERGADLMSDSETTILHLAARLSSKINGSHILFHLLRHNRVRSFINTPSSSDHRATPLLAACLMGSIEPISALIEAGAEVNPTNDELKPVAIVERLGRSPELSPNWKDHDFDVSRYQLIAERTLSMLLDKLDPSHGRSPLHLAASIGNYGRVVALVENGADVWAADSEGRTPLGRLPPESGDPDSKISDPILKNYLENCKKIFQYLQKKMVQVAGTSSSYEDVKDIFFKIKEFPEDDDTPELLGAKYTQLVENLKQNLGEDHPETLSAMSKLADSYELQDKMLECETLELEVLQKREVVLRTSDPELFESRSNQVRILLRRQNLEEAKTFAHSTLELALKHLGDDHHNTDIARFDVSQVDAAEGKLAEATDFQKELHEKVGSTEGIGFHHQNALLINFTIACSYCSLGRWEEAERELDYLVGFLEFCKKELYPLTFAWLVGLAQTHERFGKMENAHKVYAKLAENALETRGDHSFYTIKSMANLVEHYKNQSKFTEAAAVQLKVLDIFKEWRGFRHLDTQQRISKLAELYESQNRWAEANVLRQQAADVLQEMCGPTDERTLETKSALRNNLFKRELLKEAAEAGQEVVTGYKKTLGDGHSKTINAENQLALVVNSMGRPAEAAKLQEKALQSLECIHGERHQAVGAALVNLGATYLRAGRVDDGEAALKRALEINESIWGPESLQASSCISYLATAYVKAGRREESCAFHQRALEIRRKVKCSDDAETLQLLRVLAYDYFYLEQIEKAITLHNEALEGYRNLYGEQHKDTLLAISDLASAYHALQRFEEAENMYKEVLDGRRKLLGDSHDLTLAIIEVMAILYADMERWEDARPLQQEMYSRSFSKHGPDHPKTVEARSGLVAVYVYLNLWSDVEELQQEVLEVSQRTLGPSHPETIEAMQLLAEAHEYEGKYDLCEALYEKILSHHREALGPDDEITLTAIDNLATAYTENKKLTAAETLRLEALDSRIRTTGERSPATIGAKSTLAALYSLQTRHVKAEALYLSIIATLAPDDPVILETMESLAHTYSARDLLPAAEAQHVSILALRRKNAGEGTERDPAVLISMKHLEDIYIKMQRWEEARGYAIIILAAMRELAPEELLSALADLRRICYRLGDTGMVAELEAELIQERVKRGIRFGGTGRVLRALKELRDL
jgi:ankyrin repeat protein